jgi:hypothetical protein
MVQVVAQADEARTRPKVHPPQKHSFAPKFRFIHNPFLAQTSKQSYIKHPGLDPRIWAFLSNS